jgi:hypothetical protein
MTHKIDIKIHDRRKVEGDLRVTDKTGQRSTVAANGLRFKLTENPILAFKDVPEWPIPNTEAVTAHSLLLGPRDTMQEFRRLAVECNFTLFTEAKCLVINGIVAPHDIASAVSFETLLNVLVRGMHRWRNSFPDRPIGVKITLLGGVEGDTWLA